MLHVAAFAVSGYAGTNNRTLKPFNPLLGETFEFQYPEEGWRGIAEKVPLLSLLPEPCILVLSICHGQIKALPSANRCKVSSLCHGNMKQTQCTLLMAAAAFMSFTHGLSFPCHSLLYPICHKRF